MPRKAKESVENKSDGKSTAPVDSDGFYVLPKDLLMEFRALDAECRNALLELRMVGQSLEAALSKHPEIKQMMAQRAASETEVGRKRTALMELHQVMESIYPIKISEISIDDVTGRIHQLVNGQPSAEGMKPASVTAPEVKKARRGAKAKTVT